MGSKPSAKRGHISFDVSATIVSFRLVVVEEVTLEALDEAQVAIDRVVVFQGKDIQRAVLDASGALIYGVRIFDAKARVGIVTLRTA